MDTVPGRINEAWIRVPAARAGVYSGQCSELCGVNHGYMPIGIAAKANQDVGKWLIKAKKEFANEASPTKVVQKDTIVR